MLKSRNGRVRAFAALAVCYVAITFTWSSQAAPNSCFYMDSSGHRISNVFWGLLPDPKFALVLRPQIAQLQQRESIPHFQDLVYRERCPKKTLLSAALPQACPCYGQFMIQQYRSCDSGCAGGVYYGWYYSGGDIDCNGYAIVGDSCNGCEYREQHCDSCYACQ